MLKRFVLIVSSAALVVALDTLIMSHLPWYHVLVNITVVYVIVLSMIADWRYGAMAGLGLGYALSLTSVTATLTYPVALVLCSLSSSIFLRRFFAGRAQASLLATVTLSTIVFGVTAWSVSAIAHEVFRVSWYLPLFPFGWTILVQSVTHTVLISFLWRLLRRDEYHRLGSAFNQSF